MRAHRWQRKVVQTLAGLSGLLFILSSLSGCGTPAYPEDLTYPVRTDPIVITPLPPPNLYTIDGPGQLDELFAQFLSMGGKSVDPTSTGDKVEVKKLQADLKNQSGSERDDTQKKIDTLQKQIDKWDSAWRDVRPKVEDELDKLFGTPAHPKVGGISEETVRSLQVDASTLAEGSALYRKQCLHCHGLTGDGKGPTGPWVNPHPRDYRKGIFKFTSTKGGNDRKPRREDLLRTLREGIDSSSMPSFGQLPPDELEKMASYVIHLSIRGEVEAQTIRALHDNFDADTGKIDFSNLEDGSLGNQVKTSLERVRKSWTDSADKPIPATYPYTDKQLDGSIARGYKWFTKGKASCISCHGDFGRQFSYRWDDWGMIVRPADLTAGLYRGGRRPVDLYYRIHSGINGVGMPAFSVEAEPDKGTLSNEQLWDLVNFLRAIPYPGMIRAAANDPVAQQKLSDDPKTDPDPRTIAEGLESIYPR